VILVIAGALNLHRLSVEKKTIVSIKSDGPNAKWGFRLINLGAVHFHFRN